MFCRAGFLPAEFEFPIHLNIVNGQILTSTYTTYFSVSIDTWLDAGVFWHRSQGILHPLSHLNWIDECQIKMIEALGPKFARPNIIAILHGRADARAVGAALQWQAWCWGENGYAPEGVRDIRLFGKFAAIPDWVL